jgi:hypothetical protein
LCPNTVSKSSADGTVEGTDKIQRSGNVYTFLEDIWGSIVVSCDNVTIDGAGYMINGTGTGNLYGVFIEGRRSVTIQNLTIANFFNSRGLLLLRSWNNDCRDNVAL